MSELKIKIDNEEVVCNNEIVINEKMLSTSSTILKNCYPKTWEQDKDYISRYYFPKDYAKCKIYNETYHPEDIGSTIKGTNFSINYDNTKHWELKGMYGNTTQDGTPTPSSPIPINNATGEQEIRVCGKNLFDTENYTIKGNTSTWMPTQIGGTYSNSGSWGDGVIWRYELDTTQTYTFKANGFTNNVYGYLRTYTDNTYTTIKTHYIRDGHGNLLKTFTPDSKYIEIRIVSNAATSNVNITDIQLEKGNQATTYEAYNGNTYEINLGDIELNKIGTYEDRIYKDSDKWYLEKKIGKVVLKGENSEGWILSQTLTNTAHYVIPDATTVLLNCKIPPNDTTLGYLLSNYFEEKGNLYNIDSEGLDIHVNKNLICGINKTIASDLTTFKTWLSNNNTTVYYILATPTTIEITNEDLINQLEAIELLNGLNNISVSSADLPGEIEIHYNYKEAYTEEDLIFCGCIKNTGKISLNPREPHYVDLQVLDFKTLLSEGETLNYVINNKTITEAINMVISSISDYGFQLGTINIQNPNDTINAYSTLNKTAYDVFQYIADITQSRWTTRVIDENNIAIDFIDPNLEEEQEPIEYTEEYFEENEIVDISFNYSTNDYRNKQIMTSEEVYGNIVQVETKVADGYTKTFTTDNKIGQITSITIDGVEATFMTKSEEQLGITADFIYQPGETTFRSKNILSAGSVIIVSYYPIVKGREIVINSSEISRIGEQIGRKGIISRYEDRSDTTSSTELQKIGQSYIKYKGNAEITLKVISKKNLFNKGDIVEFNAPIEELDTKYLVKNKIIDMYLIANQIIYTYELSSNYNSEDAINYFDNQRAKSQGNIGEGETITRNIDIENTALIYFYDTEIEEVEIENPTSIEFKLDGVII